MDEKPADCTCQYPVIRFRNMTGHAPECPAHHRLLAEYTKPLASAQWTAKGHALPEPAPQQSPTSPIRLSKWTTTEDGRSMVEPYTPDPAIRFVADMVARQVALVMSSPRPQWATALTVAVKVDPPLVREWGCSPEFEFKVQVERPPS